MLVVQEQHLLPLIGWKGASQADVSSSGHLVCKDTAPIRGVSSPAQRVTQVGCTLKYEYIMPWSLVQQHSSLLWWIIPKQFLSDILINNAQIA